MTTSEKYRKYTMASDKECVRILAEEGYREYLHFDWFLPDSDIFATPEDIAEGYADLKVSPDAARYLQVSGIRPRTSLDIWGNY